MNFQGKSISSVVVVRIYMLCVDYSIGREGRGGRGGTGLVWFLLSSLQSRPRNFTSGVVSLDSAPLRGAVYPRLVSN